MPYASEWFHRGGQPPCPAAAMSRAMFYDLADPVFLGFLFLGEPPADPFPRHEAPLGAATWLCGASRGHLEGRP